MPGKRLNGVVVLLPGILGSTLSREGKEVWGVSAGAVMRGILSGLGTIKGLKLEADPPGVDELGDGVTPTGLVQDIHLIPGLWKIEGYTRIRNIVTSYFTLDQDQFHEFPYDWRRDIRSASRRLAEESAKWLRAYRDRVGDPNAKLILLAHSQGGLVSRYFLECLNGWRDAKLLVTFGTPYQGAINPLNFVANGFKKHLGPIPLFDLTELARSLTSLYQMMTSYACYDAGDGTLRRIAEAVEPIPYVDPSKARAGREFHEEIETAVDDHMNDEQYRAERYRTLAIVGRHQPTLQAAKLQGERLEVSTQFPGVDIDGDGTVPEVSATPHEYRAEPFAAFMRERHSELQNWPAALDHVTAAMDRLDIDVTKFRAAPIARIGMEVDDAYAAGEPIWLRLIARDDAVDARVTMYDRDSGKKIASAEAASVTDEGSSITLPPPPAGSYRIVVDLPDGEPVTDVFSVAGSEPGL